MSPISFLTLKAWWSRTAVMNQRRSRLIRNQAGVVTAADIITSDMSIDIIRPENVIATLTDDIPFYMEMTVQNGRGYVPASYDANAEQEVGVIPVDAVFSPVHRVAYRTEEARIGQFSSMIV